MIKEMFYWIATTPLDEWRFWRILINKRYNKMVDFAVEMFERVCNVVN